MFNSSGSAAAGSGSTTIRAATYWLALGLLWSFLIYGISPILYAQSGNIASGTIEIDRNADLYPATIVQMY